MLWLPVAFVCLMSGPCNFHQGRLSISIEQCMAQNRVADKAMQQDNDVKAYKTECLLIVPTQMDSL